jgi:beta-1,4-mannosyl-glycoprotein beta-1,4-N-acetylglucosaminyltransferase
MMRISNESPKVIDVFMFNGEPMAFYRLHHLRDVVDLFVVVEATTTFSGRKKDITKAKYHQIFVQLEKMGKMLRLFIDENEMPRFRRPFEREKYVRDYPLSKIITHMKGRPYILMVCDGDELPDRRFVQNLPRVYDILDQPISLDMSNHYYSFNWTYNFRWASAYVVNDRKLTNASSLDAMRDVRRRRHKRFEKAGWHCSYCMSPEMMITKLTQFSHTDYDHPLFKNTTRIKLFRERGLDLFGREGTEYKMYHDENEENLPQDRHVLDMLIEFV